VMAIQLFYDFVILSVGDSVLHGFMGLLSACEPTVN
jgi:hypothetical protein